MGYYLVEERTTERPVTHLPIDFLGLIESVHDFKLYLAAQLVRHKIRPLGYVTIVTLWARGSKVSAGALFVCHECVGWPRYANLC